MGRRPLRVQGVGRPADKRAGLRAASRGERAGARLSCCVVLAAEIDAAALPGCGMHNGVTHKACEGGRDGRGYAVVGEGQYLRAKAGGHPLVQKDPMFQPAFSFYFFLQRILFLICCVTTSFCYSFEITAIFFFFFFFPRVFAHASQELLGVSIRWIGVGQDRLAVIDRYKGTD